MTEHQGISFTSGPDGRLQLDPLPLGTVELFRSSEAEKFRSAPTANAPARIAVQPGANSVTLTFARRVSEESVRLGMA